MPTWLIAVLCVGGYIGVGIGTMMVGVVTRWVNENDMVDVGSAIVLWPILALSVVPSGLADLAARARDRSNK
jgi:hypothetical protein